MDWNDILNEIIRDLQPEYIPADHLICAKVVDRSGIQRTIRGVELEQFMANPEQADVAEARVVLNVQKIRRTMKAEIAHLFVHLEDLLKRKPD